MKKSILTAAVLAASIRLALAADPAALSIVVFDQGQPVPRTEVLVDGKPLGVTDDYGSLRVTLPAGSRELVLRAEGREVLNLDLDFAEGERAELIASLQPDGPARVQYESSQAGRSAQAQTQTPAGPPGTLAGRVVDSEGGQPIANARVFVSGTPLDIRTDADGRFSAQVPEGTYSVSVVAAEFDSRSFDGVQIVAGETATREIEITPAGLELPEFVVLEPYVEGSLASFVEEKRESAGVLDILGAEQISRAGDSDAAGALKRVTGLTLVDGKFVYVRGLGERYSSVLLNGAQIPSPDPTRRVVPLDLFPTEILEGITVQKTYSANMPGEFAGGTIELRTKPYPKEFDLKVSAAIGYADGTTGEDGLRYDGGGRDWLGRDDGTREEPGELGPPFPTASSNPQGNEAAGEALAGMGYTVHEESLDPNSSFALGIGDSFQMTDDIELGYIGALRYAQSWDNLEEERNEFSLSGDGSLIPKEEFDRTRTEREIDTAAFLTVGAGIGENHTLSATAMLIRLTTDETRIDEGYKDSANDIIRLYELEWIENELLTRQFAGEHKFPTLSDLEIDWLYTLSDASRYAPNTRNYRYDFIPSRDRFEFSRNSGNNEQSFAELDDQAEELGVGLALPLELGGETKLTLAVGGDRLEREREAFERKYSFRLPAASLTGGLIDIEDFLTPELIGSGPGQATLQQVNLLSAAYTAEQQLDAYFVTADLELGPKYRINLGLRREDNLQSVSTFEPLNPNLPPVVGLLDEANNLPSVLLTWAYSDNAQFRIGYSESLSRPDFREMSRAQFTDPIIDVSTRGNPDLEQTEITNYDLRWEYYFSASESFSAALFYKDFLKPIEKVRVPGTGELLEMRNAEEATNYGIEFDYYRGFEFLEDRFAGTFLDRLPWSKLFLGLNYAWIESEVTIGPDAIGVQTTDNRPLQSQSPYVANIQLGYQDPDRGTEATLLYNVFGERISEVGVQGLPDVYEQPFHQLDFVFSQSFAEHWKFKARLRNLLDPDAEFTQGDAIKRRSRKGREIQFSLEWRW